MGQEAAEIGGRRRRDAPGSAAGMGKNELRGVEHQARDRPAGQHERAAVAACRRRSARPIEARWTRSWCIRPVCGVSSTSAAASPAASVR